MITHQYNLFKGTLLDTHGNTTIESNTSFDRKEKGLAIYCNGTDAKFELGDIGDVKSIAFVLNLKSLTEQIFEGDPNAHLIHANAGTLIYPDFDNAFVDGVDTDSITTGWHLVVVTSTTDVACSDAVLGLNNATYGELWCGKISVYGHELTTKEIAGLMQEFNRMTNSTRAVEDNLDYPALKPTDLSNEPGLVAAYNMIPSPGGVLVDISGNGYNGDITGAISNKDGLEFDGNDHIELSDGGELNPIGDFTWNFRINTGMPAANNARLLSNSVAANGYEFYLNTSSNLELKVYTAVGNEEKTISGNLDQNQLHTLTVVKTGDIYTVYLNGVNDNIVTFTAPVLATTENIHIGATPVPNNWAKLNTLNDLQMFNYALSEKEAIAYHNQFAKEIHKRLELSDHGVGSTI